METIKGLTHEEVEEKIKQGKSNKVKIKTNESILKILRKNIFTYFNFIFLILTILLITSHSYRNLTFLGIIITNILIGIIQQIRSKITLDKLSLLDKNKYIVIRDGKEEEIDSDNLVEGDFIILEAGKQIPADAEVVSGKIYVNESLLTGEQNEIEKSINSNLMSGSFVISGRAVVKLTNVGDESFSAKIMKESKKIKETKSEMISAIDNIVKFAGIIIIPIGILLFIGSYGVNGCSYEESVNSMVSALLGMIPEGLYLLTTVALALSSMRLAQNKILLHDMKSIESLARVDVLCVDKTGTITNNTMKVLDIFDKNGNNLIDKKEDLKILAKYINTIEDKNITIDAIKEQLYGISTEKLSNIEKENFNSKNKFSFIKIDENVTYKLGAPEILLNKEYEELVNKRTKNGERLIAFVEVKNNETIPILFISLKNEIRKNAKEIFEFFDNRNVQIRVISGDNPITVSSIAKQAGIKGYEKYIDCRELKNYADIQKAVKKYIVFGRVNPEQKRQIIKALKEQGYMEITLLGQNVNAYGKDLNLGYDFATLLENVAKIGIPRIRFVTSHPWNFTDRMVDVIAKYDNIMPYVHLPIQSGSDEILKRMNRKYTIEEYKKLFDQIKKKVKNVAITTDIIVGFPNETDEDFQKTLDIVNYCKFDGAYTFIFSPREGTAAAKMEDKVPMHSLESNQKMLGKTLDVLVVGLSEKDSNKVYGYTETMKLVNIVGNKDLIGKIVPVKITDAKSFSLDGENSQE